MALPRCVSFSWRLGTLIKNSSITRSTLKSCDIVLPKSDPCFLPQVRCFVQSTNFLYTSRTFISLRALTNRRNVLNTANIRRYSTNKPDNTDASKTDQSSLTVFQRFKKTYKEHGKILITVHVVTSSLWFGAFYMLAISGLDIVPLMEKIGFGDTLIKPFRSGGLGFVAVAYLLYKIATPARYTLTLGGANLIIRYLRRKGKMQKVPPNQSIRNLYKDGKVELRDKQIAFKQRRRAFKIRKQRVARNGHSSHKGGNKTDKS